MAAIEFFKDMLGRYRPGETISEDDQADLATLLERHDEYKQKVRDGVDHFQVMMTEHGTPCFRIIRRDGSGTDFSYRHCITQRPPSRKQEVTAAFRRVVRFDLYKARDEFIACHQSEDGTIICAETGNRILPDQAHMDHRAPMTFEVLVTTFLQGRGLSFDDVALTSGADEQVSPEVLDSVLSADFRHYHAKLAAIDMVEARVNLSLSARKRMKPTRIRLDG
jgi:hypothetical protein